MYRNCVLPYARKLILLIEFLKNTVLDEKERKGYCFSINEFYFNLHIKILF